MSRRLVEIFSNWAVEKRGIILVVCALVAAGFGAMIPRLKVDTSPDSLVSAVAGQGEVEERFREHFTRFGSQLLVVLQAQDVTSDEALQYQYRLHESLAKLSGVAQVDGLTHLPLLPLAPAADDAGNAPQELDDAALAKMTPDQRQQLQAGQEAESPFSRQTLEAIVKNDEAFPGGLTALGRRIAALGDSPRLTGEKQSREDVARFREALHETPGVVPVLLSRDGTTAAIVVHFDDELVHDQETRMAALERVRSAVNESEPPAGVTTLLGGVPLLREAILHKLDVDRFTLNPAMMVICLLILGLTFRWWPAVVAPICAVGIAALIVIGGMALLGQPLTILTNIIPPLLIIVGLSDSVHLLGRYTEELKTEPDRVEAGRKATRAMLVACFLTSLTTAVGFGSLAFAKTAELSRFGIAAAAGVVFAYFATVFFVPAFVTFFRVPRHRDAQGSAKPKVSLLEKSVFVVTRHVLRHAKLVTVLSFASAIGLGYGATQITADARLLDAFEEGEETTRVTHLIEDKLSGIRALEVLITVPQGSLLEPEKVLHVEEVTSWLQKESGVIFAASYVDPLRAMRELLAENPPKPGKPFASLEQLEALSEIASHEEGESATPWISPDGRAARLTVFFQDVGIRRTLVVLDQLRSRLSEAFPHQDGAEVSFLGEAYSGSVSRDFVLRDLLWGLGGALVIIFVLLALLFRSLPLAIVAMPPNVIPLLATGAYMMARGIQLNMATVITFSIGIGLAVDDTVHVVARYREESRRISSVSVALLRAARGTGTAIVVTAISLSLGFSVLMLSEFVSVREFGELIAVTVINCLLGALLVQPALLVLVSRRARRAGA